MAFSDFKYPDCLTDLHLKEDSAPLFADVMPVAPSDTLIANLYVGTQLAPMVHTEAARSTWLVGPILSDLWLRYRGRIGLYAGVEFSAVPEEGLSGYCDFLLTRGPQLPHVTAPVAVIFEAKRDSIPDGLGQCIAGMVAIQRFNRRAGQDIDPVYGCVTTGSLWKFLRLSAATVAFDLAEYQISQADRLLGILTHIAGPVPPAAAA